MSHEKFQIDPNDTLDVIIKKPVSAKGSCSLEVTPKPLRKPWRPCVREVKLPLLTREPSTSYSSEFLGRGVSLPKTDIDRSDSDLTIPVRGGSIHIPEMTHEQWSGLCKGDGSPTEGNTSELQLLRRPSTWRSPGIQPGQSFYPEAISGVSPCPDMIRLPFPDPSFDIDVSDKTPVEESSALKNWNMWMRRRNYQHVNLRDQMNIKPCKLVMNKGEDVRRINEDKQMFDYATVPVADKFRGHPAFWYTGARLFEKGMIQEYIRSKGPKERGEVPTMEFVGVPTAIKEEKDILCDGKALTRSKDMWNEMKYRKEQAIYHSKQRKKMRPHNIDMDNLVIVGEKIPLDLKEETMKSPEGPEIVITEVDESFRNSGSKSDSTFEYLPRKDKRRLSEDRQSVLKLIIDGQELSENVSAIKSEHYCWTIQFPSTSLGTLSKATLTVENKGTVAIRYSWKLRKTLRNTLVHPKRSIKIHEPWFFFNKNSGIFLPGQLYNLDFYHHSKRTGFQNERWALITSPKLLSDDEEIHVDLIAISLHDYSPNDLSKIEDYINRCVESSHIKRLKQEIVERVQEISVGDLEYRSLFVEEEFFEYQNPRHNYRSNIVKELKDMYKKFPLDPSHEWDYSLTTMQKCIRKYFKGEKMQEYLQKLARLAEAMLAPNYPQLKSKKKYLMVYNVLCRMANLIEDDSNYLKKCLCHKPPALFFSPYGEDFGEGGLPYIKSASSTRKSSSTISLPGPEEPAEPSLYEISPLDLAHYQQAFYIEVYHRLGEAIEQIAAVVQSCKLFEHKGEINLNI